MKKLKFGFLGLALFAIAACSKHSDSVSVAPPQIQIGQPVSNAAPLAAGTYKGTMLANQTFTVNGDITVNAGDTLLIQKGVKINVNNGSHFFVNGTLICLGTSDAPITITDPRRTKTTGPSSFGTDSAYVGGWGGIYCSNSCKLLVIKWTHLDFGGAALKAAPFPAPTQTKANQQFVLFFENPNGALILEDSWVYGTPDDVTRFYGGAMNIVGNTLEKCGGQGGDGLNAKGSSYGNMAYNLIIGGATNGTKTASDGTTGLNCQFAMYNNTYVNDGFRNNGVFGARSGSVEVENNSRALVYNNLIVDCNFGVRIAGGPGGQKVYLADTTSSNTYLFPKTAYGYNYYYADNAAIAGQFVPDARQQAVVTHPQATDIPNMAAFLGASYTFGLVYDGSPLVGKNNPMFVNYTLPNLNFATTASVDGYNFHLAPGSPAIGKGTTNASLIKPITAGIPVDANFGASEILAPGADIGCFQTNGTGNHH